MLLGIDSIAGVTVLSGCDLNEARGRQWILDTLGDKKADLVLRYTIYIYIYTQYKYIAHVNNLLIINVFVFVVTWHQMLQE